MKTLDALMEDATQALAQMDAPALERLNERALELRALRAEGMAPAETMARFRVFASVLRGTEKGLTVLTRMRDGGAAWGR